MKARYPNRSSTNRGTVARTTGKRLHLGGSGARFQMRAHFTRLRMATNSLISTAPTPSTSQPYPLAGGDRPGTTLFRRFDAEKTFGQTMAGAADRSRSVTQRNPRDPAARRRIRTLAGARFGARRRHSVSGRGLRNDLCGDRRPALEPCRGFLFQFVQSLLRKTFAARREVKTREKLTRIGDPAWRGFGIKVRRYPDALGRRFDQVTELSPANLPALVRPDEQRLILTHAH